MNDQDYIKEGVGLAPDIGWVNDDGSIFFHGVPEKVINPNNCPSWFKAALAAQLTEQVDAMDDYYVVTHNTHSRVFKYPYEGTTGCLNAVRGKNRSMNTIKVIVDSKVLKCER